MTYRSRHGGQARPRRFVTAVLAVSAAVLGMLVAGQQAASAAAVTIKSFTPTSGAYGTQVTVTGTAFSADDRVYFGKAMAVPLSHTSTQLVVDVPLGAVTGPLKVTNSDVGATSKAKFKVLRSLGVSPGSLPPGQPMTVFGSSFGLGEQVDVYFDTTEIGVVSADSRFGSFQLATRAPTWASPGNHTLLGVGRTSGGQAQATVTIHADWPEMGANVGMTGVNPYEHTLGTSNVGDMGKSWSFNSATSAGNASAVVVNQTIYVNGGGANAFWAIDEATGNVKWATNFPVDDFSGLPAGSDSTPIVVGGTVYVGDGFGDVFALNADTGVQLWEYQPNFGDVGGITYSAGVLYLVRSEGFEESSTDALNAATGAVLWSTQFNRQALTDPICDGLGSTPVVASGLVIIPCQGQLVAFHASDGTVAWTANAPVNNTNNVAVLNGYVYATDHTAAAAFAVSNGAQLWSTRFVQSGAAADHGGIALHGALMYVGSESGYLIALDDQTGVIQWSHYVGDVPNTPAYANGVVYTGTDGGTGRLYALDANTGTPLWSYPRPGCGPVVVDDGQLIVASGVVDAFGLPSSSAGAPVSPAVRAQ